MLHKFLNLGHKRGVAYVTWPTFKFWDCLYISGTTEARKFTFWARIDNKEYYGTKCKTRSNRYTAYVMWPTFKFWDCLHISGTAEAKNFKFGAQIDNNECYRKNAKLGQICIQPTSRDLLFNFGTASISPERLVLETSSLVPKLTVRSTIEKM